MLVRRGEIAEGNFYCQETVPKLYKRDAHIIYYMKSSLFLLCLEKRHDCCVSISYSGHFPTTFLQTISFPSKIWLPLTLAFLLTKANQHKLILLPYSFSYISLVTPS